MNDLHSTVGAYAADALDPVERVDFETHLADCRSCQIEASEFAETLARLAPLVAAAPPAALRATVLTSVAGVRQLPRQRVAREDRVSRETDAGAETPRRSRVASVTEIRPLDPDEVAPLEEHPSVVPESPWLGITAALSDDLDVRRGQRKDRVLAALVAAALAMAVILGGWAYVSTQQNQTRVAEAQRETELLTASDARVYDDTANGAAVAFVVSKQKNEALFVADKLPEPGSGRVYQLWTVNDGTARSAGVLTDDGSVRQWIRRSVTNADGLALSVELAPDGSPTPSDIVAEVEF